MPVDKKLLEELQAKGEDDLTPAEKALLELSAAEQGDDTVTEPEDEKFWEKAFTHPRFKELVTAKKQAEDKLKTIEAVQKKKEVERLAKNNEFQTLYEQSIKELEEAKLRASTADELEEVLKKTLVAELETLHPDAKKLVPASLSVAQQLEYISANRTLLERKDAGDIGAGRRTLSNGGKIKSTELTAEEREIARRFGQTDEQYVRFRDVPSQPSNWQTAFQDKNNDKDKGENK